MLSTMHRHRFPQMRRRPSHVRCVYITQYALARSLARHCQPDSNCLHAQQNPRVLSHHTHSIAAECALAGATMHIIHSVSRIYTDRRRMTFTFLLRWPSSCLNPILMRTDDVVDVDKCDALVLAICWLLQHNFHDCPNYNLSVTHDDYSDLPSQRATAKRERYTRRPIITIRHIFQIETMRAKLQQTHHRKRRRMNKTRRKTRWKLIIDENLKFMLVIRFIVQMKSCIVSLSCTLELFRQLD